MQAGAVAASLLAVMAANSTLFRDCVCNRIEQVFNRHGDSGPTDGQRFLWIKHCEYKTYPLFARCDAQRPPSTPWAAVARLTPRTWSYGLPLPTDKVQRPTDKDCAATLQAVRGVSAATASQLLAGDRLCRAAADCVQYYSIDGLNATDWNVESLEADHLREPLLSQLVSAVRRITTAIHARSYLVDSYSWHFYKSYHSWDRAERRAEMAAYLERLSGYWRDTAGLISLGVADVQQLFLPLAFEDMGNMVNDQQLHGWIKHMNRLRDMLHTKLMGWVLDVQSISKQTLNYKVEEDKNRPGHYLIRRPLLNDDLLYRQEPLLSFHSDFSALCRRLQPKAPQMLALADALYDFYRYHWIDTALSVNRNVAVRGAFEDEEWQLDDRSSDTLSVDTDCLQLLADALDHPRCPLEELPPETTSRRLQCRRRLWQDVVQRSPHMPVTSYLAYTQRAGVRLCLLAWMAVNSFSVCLDVPFSTVRSVLDARCLFQSPGDLSCLQSNATDAICSVSRALLLLRCREFSFRHPPKVCGVKFHTYGAYSATFETNWTDGAYKWYGNPTATTLSYKDSLSSATLKYKDFTVQSLKVLEISFVAANILFRLLAAGVYVYLPHLRNLPGMIFLSFQITGIAQISCSEVAYRMAGVPDLSTTVLVDSSLTLLSCLWLNAFCYQMYACVRHLRLPNDLLPADARRVFRRLALYVLIPWSAVSAAGITLEKTSVYYLLHSRVLFLTAISLSIAYNLACLGLVGYMYLRARKSMTQLEIYNNDNFGSKKQILYLSVNTVILSGIGVIIRIGFHQAQGIAQFVYYVHIATMMQGPLLFVFFVCNETTLPILKNRILAWCNPDFVSPGQEMCSTAERNLSRRRNQRPLAAETSL